MAELALLASIVQIADTGYRLSLKLYTSGEAIARADRTIITISKDISLTSTVLQELGEILRRDQDEKESICSENLVKTAGNTVKECLDAFEELDSMILKNMPNLSQGHRATRATMALERLKWPFIQPRIQLLRGNLDMVRANISLMLNVLIYARHVSDRKKSRAPAPGVYDEITQKTIIEELVSAKEEYVRKFESLKLSIPASPLTQTVHNTGTRAAPAPTEEKVVHTQHTFSTLPTTTLQRAPAPPYNPFSATIPQNAPAPQWPLPNIPASYPIAPMDPVAVQSDQFNSWPLLSHLKTLVASLIREVYSPVYQIPTESRSRFTGVIRATHETEIVEAERRESSKYSDGSLGSGLRLDRDDPIAARRSSIGSNLTTATPDFSPLPSCMEPPHIYSSVHRRPANLMQITQVQSRRREHEDDEEQPATKKAKTVPAEDSYSSAEFPQDNTLTCFDHAIFFIGPEPERNDVVDDLVKLWTLVR